MLDPLMILRIILCIALAATIVYLHICERSRRKELDELLERCAELERQTRNDQTPTL